MVSSFFPENCLPFSAPLIPSCLVQFYHLQIPSVNGINVTLLDTLEVAHGVKFFVPVEEAFLPVLGGSNSQLELTINALLVNHVSDHIRPSVSSHFLR